MRMMHEIDEDSIAAAAARIAAAITDGSMTLARATPDNPPSVIDVVTGPFEVQAKSEA
jgi:hypothetical protein